MAKVKVSELPETTLAEGQTLYVIDGGVSKKAKTEGIVELVQTKVSSSGVPYADPDTTIEMKSPSDADLVFQLPYDSLVKVSASHNTYIIKDDEDPDGQKIDDFAFQHGVSNGSAASWMFYAKAGYTIKVQKGSANANPSFTFLQILGGETDYDAIKKRDGLLCTNVDLRTAHDELAQWSLNSPPVGSTTTPLSQASLGFYAYNGNWYQNHTIAVGGIPQENHFFVSGSSVNFDTGSYNRYYFCIGVNQGITANSIFYSLRPVKLNSTVKTQTRCGLIPSSGSAFKAWEKCWSFIGNQYIPARDIRVNLLVMPV